MGSAILFTYPEISTIAGLQGLFVYALCSAIPIMAFAYLTPIIRRKCPEGFVLTEWVRHRYGPIAGLWLSFLTCATMFLYMIAELGSVKSVVELLTGLNGTVVVIVQVIVTTIYTSLGGFKVSFVTDNIQGTMICGLVIICACAVGTSVKLDKSLIPESELLKPTLLGWQLIWILFIGIVCSDMFLSGFWMRAFAAKTDRDLKLGVSMAAVAIFIVLSLVGSTGLLAVWSGAVTRENGYISFFALLMTLPDWVVGLVIVMVVALSTAVYDSLQSAMVSTASNDLFRNKINLLWIRGLVVLLSVPIVILALRVQSIITIYLISNILATTTMPSLLLGLSSRFYFLRQFDVIFASFGGLFAVFFFGLVYYDGDANAAISLLLLKQGLYGENWSAFGTFVASFLGGLIALALAVGGRLSVQWVMCKRAGTKFDGLDRPVVHDSDRYEVDAASATGEPDQENLK
ncbi:hypothetical protein BJ508DRAFT_137641 [Ascobolus immersus RN42]|uniref:Urea transporter n=1 Tax=Ascobolus immersus RN42 TaxID=1160509 RepID=A0A3N4I6B3_ASCIM|nr:hypothetical protein BJ508DRAFT_137641 [Ascobolus immersus RN42]